MSAMYYTRQLSLIPKKNKKKVKKGTKTPNKRVLHLGLLHPILTQPFHPRHRT